MLAVEETQCYRLVFERIRRAQRGPRPWEAIDRLAVPRRL